MASGAGQWSTAPIDDYETLISTTEEQLKRAWRNALIKRAKEQIQLREETVDDFIESGHDPLIVSLYQMYLDRAQFLLRSYLRVRLQKIEKLMFYIRKSDVYRNQLSVEEEKSTENDIRTHLEETVLSKLPDGYQSEDDMDPEPQFDAFVVAICDRATRPVHLDGSRQSASFVNSKDDHFQMVPGDLCILRCKPFQEELKSGNINLV